MNILDLFCLNKKIDDLKDSLLKNKYNLLCSHTNDNFNYILTYLSYVETNNTIIYVCENSYKASQTYDYLCRLAGSDNVSLYLFDEIVSSELVAVSSDFRYERINTIRKIIENKPQIVVTFLQPLIKPLMPIKEFKDRILDYVVGDTINVENFSKSLIESGYKRTPTCELVGEFSIRGEVIDIFPLFCDQPIRIDLFDNEIEWLKEYDIETQKTLKDVQRIKIYPMNDFIYSKEKMQKAIVELQKYNVDGIIDNDLNDIENFLNPERISKYINYFYSDSNNFLDYLDDKVVLFNNYSAIKSSYELILEDINNIKIKTNANIKYFSEFETVLNGQKNIFLEDFCTSNLDVRYTQIINFDASSVINFNNDIKLFIETLKLEKGQVIIACHDHRACDLIRSILEESQIIYRYINKIGEINNQGIYVCIINNALSFTAKELRVISDDDVFKNIYKKKSNSHFSQYNSQPISSKEELKVGDYIVHIDYGIAIYLGLKTVELENIKNDYLVLKYDNMELYVPVEKINLIEKYQGSEGITPKLSKIGTDEWKKKKAKIKEKVEKIALELINTQSERLAKKGMIYPKDDDLQLDFEKKFEFELTKDQAKSINEIKKDMEEGLIIDRLICGDVGYGKTEIAMRIAFKTVLSGQQVAYLAPTTILTRQHYNTFVERFKEYGINVAMLNRLTSAKDQKEIIDKLKQGTIDIVIGTHRLLSADVHFKQLGLLIIDEEQRFGVIHKEKIKKLKTDINVLTLTATPIPRTLQLSIMGIRQFSLIQTPPKDRFPIQTYVLEYNDTVIKEAIYKELSRKGQVFYLHNNISTLNNVVNKLKKLVPEARVCYAHGKMDKDMLEDVIQMFIDKDYDVLVCTTIIETGIDIPNSNTMIIDDVDRFGLSQLYQIRGRIGRSDRIAYAYLTYKKGKVLSETGSKRLKAIKEFTSLGSGYKIAVRDLAIRGAGDILGSEQSGFIDMIGMDMYMKMLNDSVKKLQGKYEQKQENSYNFQISKHVSSQYVPDEEIKILIHNMINKIKSKEDKKQIIDELTDRFGKISKDNLLYIEETYLKSLLNKFNILEIQEQDSFIRFVFPEKESNLLDGEKLFLTANKISNNFYFEYKNKCLLVRLLCKTKDKKWIYQVCRLLENL